MKFVILFTLLASSVSTAANLCVSLSSDGLLMPAGPWGLGTTKFRRLSNGIIVVVLNETTSATMEQTIKTFVPTERGAFSVREVEKIFTRTGRFVSQEKRATALPALPENLQPSYDAWLFDQVEGQRLGDLDRYLEQYGVGQLQYRDLYHQILHKRPYLEEAVLEDSVRAFALLDQLELVDIVRNARALDWETPVQLRELLESPWEENAPLTFSDNPSAFKALRRSFSYLRHKGFQSDTTTLTQEILKSLVP